MVAALGGTAHRSPLMPKLPCSEFWAIVNGLSVQTRGPSRFHSSRLAAENSGASRLDEGQVAGPSRDRCSSSRRRPDPQAF